MAIKTYKIRAEIKLYSHSEKDVIDLTPFVKTLSVRKDLYGPSGSFDISLLPVSDKTGLRRGLSWYYRIAPMDYVEIRFTRDSLKTKIPIVMRGFVDNVNHTATVDQNGAPHRGFNITGRDFGKIMEITRIYYLKEVDADIRLLFLPGFERIKERYGALIEGPPWQIIEALHMAAQHQLDFIRSTQPHVPSIEYLYSKSIEGNINQFALTQDDGSIWEMMQFFDNSPWNELFVTDLESGPVLVFRESPWKDFDAAGQYIQTMDPDVLARTIEPLTEIEPSSILNFSLSRSDGEVKNYFFSYPVQNMINGQTGFKAAVLQGAKTAEDLKANPYVINREDPDAGLNRFGFRRFENTSEFFDPFELAISKRMAEKLNLNLVKAFRYNGLYESGSFTMKGNDQIRPGRYVQFNTRSGVKPEFYVVGVNHELNFEVGSESFITSISVQRGDGFLKTRKGLQESELAYS